MITECISHTVQKSNETQIKILTHLLFNPKSKFKELNTDSLSTDRFSYHIKSLINLGLIEKKETLYHLTNEGKITASKIDTDKHEFEKQPKVSVIVIAHKTIRGKRMFVIHQRTKEPYFGYWGFITGKVRWGETLAKTSERELNEEIGISGNHKFCYGIHEMVYEKSTNQLLEDKFFHIMEATNLRGKIQEKTKDGINKWVTAEEFLKITPKYHNENDLMNWYLNENFDFKEESYFIDSF